MKLDTIHFGLIEIDDGDVLSFPEGLPGFEETKQYTILGKDDNDTPFLWLQCVDKPNVCFVVTDPFLVYNDYAVDIDESDVKKLLIESNQDVMVLCIVVIPDNPYDIRTNLKAPVLVNIKKKVGKQVIQKNEDLPIRFYFNKQS